MKLDYNIMWFEDQPDSVNSFKARLEQILSQDGFRLNVEMHPSTSQTEINDLSSRLQVYNPYDLIIFDHDLGGGQLGSSIAQLLRRSIFTDMVYYSATHIDVLRKELFDKKIDGVFLVNKGNFVVDMQGIIEDHIKKMTDMNAMRGLVLDAISEIEAKLRAILCVRINAMIETDKVKILEKFKERHKNRSNQLKTVTDNLTLVTLEQHISDYSVVDFNLIRQRLAKIETSCTILGDDQDLGKIQILRNLLAHQPYRFNPKTNEVIITTERGDETFNLDRFREIRKNLLSIFAELKKLNPVGTNGE